MATNYATEKDQLSSYSFLLTFFFSLCCALVVLRKKLCMQRQAGWPAGPEPADGEGCEVEVVAQQWEGVARASSVPTILIPPASASNMAFFPSSRLAPHGADDEDEFSCPDHGYLYRNQLAGALIC